jgi:F-type H+-transporting ATPase subunit beta
LKNGIIAIMKKGEIKQIIGPVVDVYFEGHLPEIRNALEIKRGEDDIVVLEVAAHIGVGRVRAISMRDTGGLSKGMEVIDTEAPISVPVGKNSLGRLFNTLGEPLDEGVDIPADSKR